MAPSAPKNASGLIQMIMMGKSICKMWVNVIPELKEATKKWGRLRDLDKFDATFFGIPPKQANLMDPQLRFLLEATYEALIDAGRN